MQNWVVNADDAVALLAEGVDRNFTDTFLKARREESPSSRRAWIEMFRPAQLHHPYTVALLAEGVDRNILWTAPAQSRRQVALLAEGVDRNIIDEASGVDDKGRPPRGGRG